MAAVSKIAALGAGAGAMYLLDPVAGRRRRAVLRDKLKHFGRVATRKADVTFRDLLNRTSGVVAKLESKLVPEPVPDQVLVERVRAKLGRNVSHPHAVCVDAKNGIVTLTGLILSNEVQNFVNVAKAVPGVERVQNQLEVHDRVENIPALQGGKTRPGTRIDLFQTRWAPATRLLIGVAAGIAALTAVRKLE